MHNKGWWGLINENMNRSLTLKSFSVLSASASGRDQIDPKLPGFDKEVICKYRKVSNIRPTKCQNLNDSHLVLQLSVPNPLKPGVKSRIKM